MADVYQYTIVNEVDDMPVGSPVVAIKACTLNYVRRVRPVLA